MRQIVLDISAAVGRIDAQAAAVGRIEAQVTPNGGHTDALATRVVRLERQQTQVMKRLSELEVQQKNRKVQP